VVQTTLGDALFRFAAANITQDLGEQEFERFTELARNTNVPDLFWRAANNVLGEITQHEDDPGSAYVASAQKVFGGHFSVDEAIFLLSYAQALSIIRSWQNAARVIDELEIRLEENRRRLVQFSNSCGFSVEDFPSILREHKLHQCAREFEFVQGEIEKTREGLVEIKSALDRLRDLSVRACGAATLAESRFLPPEKEGGNFRERFQWFWRTIKWQCRRRLANKPGPERLEELCAFLEDYFSRESNTNRILLLAQSRDSIAARNFASLLKS